MNLDSGAAVEQQPVLLAISRHSLFNYIPTILNPVFRRNPPPSITPRRHTPHSPSARACTPSTTHPAFVTGDKLFPHRLTTGNDEVTDVPQPRYRITLNTPRPRTLSRTLHPTSHRVPHYATSHATSPTHAQHTALSPQSMQQLHAATFLHDHIIAPETAVLAVVRASAAADQVL